MNLKIELRPIANLHDTYRVYYTDASNKGATKLLSGNTINSILNMRQKEELFIGFSKFNIESEYDFRKHILNN